MTTIPSRPDPWRRRADGKGSSQARQDTDDDLQMNPPSPFEIEKFVIEKFQADFERRINEYAQKQAQTLAQVRSTGNIAGYLPALIQCKQEHLRAEILALADAWVEVATIYAVPLHVWAEKALEKAAADMATGVVSALHGEIDLMAERTRIPRSNSAGNREIESAMKSALREGKVRLKTQRIQAERSLRDVHQSIQSSSETQDPVWNVRGGGDDPETPRESFKRLARRAVVALGQSFSNPTEAVDVWLVRLHKFYEGRKSRRYAPENWRVNHVLEASAEYCAELGTRFRETGDSDAERTFADLERHFRELPDPRADLTAVRRREASFEETGAELTQPATGVATKGRKRGPKPDFETPSKVAEIVARVAPDGEWRGRLDDVCEALDEAKIPFPAKWRRDRQCRCWADCLEKPIIIKAIEYRLEIAKQRSEPTPETLS